MEFRHLETLLAVVDNGSFTGAADDLGTVQSNISDQIQQLERDLGVKVLVRGRRGAKATEFGEVVLERARRIRAELQALQVDISMLQGLETGKASLGVVGTSSRWLVPALVADLQRSAPGVQLRVAEGASERLAADVIQHELSQAVITEPINDVRLQSEALLEEELVALLPRGMRAHRPPLSIHDLAEFDLVLPPSGNPLRSEIDDAARAAGVELRVPVEVEGIRLVVDLVAAGVGATVVPATAARVHGLDIRVLSISDVPPRRLSLIYLKDAPLSLADQAVRERIRALVWAR